MKKSDYQYYISGTIKLGVSFSIISLLARWVTGNTILSAPETLIKYGITGGIGYALMGGMALILFGTLAKKIRENFPEGQTIGDVLRSKLHPIGYWYMIAILLITSLDSLFVQAMGAGILIHILFPIPVFLGLLVFLAFCFLIGGIGGMQKLHQLAGINVALIFGAVIVIPVYFFIQEGVHPVYEGIKLFHPYILYFKNTDSIMFIVSAILIGFGQMIIDRATWQRLFIIQKEKVRITFTLAGVIWATIPLALSTLIMIIIFGRSYHNIYSLIFELIDKIQSTVLIILFVLFCFSAISSAISSELHATSSLFVKNVMELFKPLTNQEKWKYSYFVSSIICLSLFVVVSILTPNPLQLLFFFGNIYAALIGPMIFIILSKRPVPSIVPLSSLIGALGGHLILPLTQDLQAIGFSFLISSLICLLIIVYLSLIERG